MLGLGGAFQDPDVTTPSKACVTVEFKSFLVRQQAPLCECRNVCVHVLHQKNRIV